MVNPLILNGRSYLLIAESNACMQFAAFTHNLLLEAYSVDYKSRAYSLFCSRRIMWTTINTLRQGLLIILQHYYFLAN